MDDTIDFAAASKGGQVQVVVASKQEPDRTTEDRISRTTTGGSKGTFVQLI